MIQLNEDAILEISNWVIGKVSYLHGQIVYSDGDILSLGEIRNGEGNFLYDKDYVYKWSFNRYMPVIYDINSRCELIDRKQKELVLGKYKKYI